MSIFATIMQLKTYSGVFVLKSNEHIPVDKVFEVDDVLGTLWETVSCIQRRTFSLIIK